MAHSTRGCQVFKHIFAAQSARLS